MSRRNSSSVISTALMVTTTVLSSSGNIRINRRAHALSLLQATRELYSRNCVLPSDGHQSSCRGGPCSFLGRVTGILGASVPLDPARLVSWKARTLCNVSCCDTHLVAYCARGARRAEIPAAPPRRKDFCFGPRSTRDCSI